MKEFIDKLIGRLEENGQKMCEAKSSVPFGKHSPANHRYYKAISVKKAIFIINQLAEEYNNDFCEWKYDGTMYDRCPHTETLFARIHNCDEKIFKYCPYCGKKIKIAPYQPKGE